MSSRLFVAENTIFASVAATQSVKKKCLIIKLCTNIYVLVSSFKKNNKKELNFGLINLVAIIRLKTG